MTNLAYRRLAEEIPARLAISAVAFVIAGFVYQSLGFLRETPTALAVVLLVIFGTIVGLFRLFRARARSESATHKHDNPADSSPLSSSLDSLASPEHRCHAIVDVWRSLAPSAADEAAGLCREWLDIVHKHERDIGKLRSAVAKHAPQRYLVVVEDALQSGALFEEIIEELGVPVRRFPSTSSLFSDQMEHQYVIFVTPDLPDKEKVISFTDMVDEPERFEAAFSTALLHRRHTVSPKFINALTSVISRLAHASLVLSQARRRG